MDQQIEREAERLVPAEIHPWDVRSSAPPSMKALVVISRVLRQRPVRTGKIVSQNPGRLGKQHQG